MDFPRTVDEITPEWLTNVLRESGAIDKSTVESVSANVLDGGATSEVQKLISSTISMPSKPRKVSSQKSLIRTLKPDHSLMI
jgi:hypothetical protein